MVARHVEALGQAGEQHQVDVAEVAVGKLALAQARLGVLHIVVREVAHPVGKQFHAHRHAAVAALGCIRAHLIERGEHVQHLLLCSGRMGQGRLCVAAISMR